MTYDTWKTETARGPFTPRSAALKVVDKAFDVVKNTSTATLVPKKALFKALEDWIKAQKAKGKDWKQSTRNSTKQGGKGTVERLLADFSTDGYFRPQVLQLNALTVTIPTVGNNVYSPGKWENTKDQDGHWHEFIRQSMGNSCVPTTIVMVKRAIHNLAATQLSETQIRGTMALEETGNLNTGISSLSNAAQMHHDWENNGTGPDHAVNVLRAQPYPVTKARKLTSTGSALLAELRKCTGKVPGLIGWRWHGGGGHFTVCCGPTTDGSKLMILDPYHAIEYVDNTPTGFNSYRNGTGYLGVAIVCH